MTTKLILRRAVTQLECPWLDQDLDEGTVVWSYDNHVYGCISPEGRAVSAKAAETPFFELPKDAVEEVG